MCCKFSQIISRWQTLHSVINSSIRYLIIIKKYDHSRFYLEKKQTNKNHQIFFFSKTRPRFLARLALAAAMLVSAKRKKKKRHYLRILFVSPFHCVKPRAIISFGKLLLQQFFLQVLLFKYSFKLRNTHTHKEKQTHKTKQKQSTLKIKQKNSTPFKLMHLSIVSNRILLLGLPEFKNGLKADVEVSLMLRTL